MKPTQADLRFWERMQAKCVPWWAYSLERQDRVKSFARPSREKAIAEALHLAINARSSEARRDLSLANALSLLVLARDNNTKGLNAEFGNTLEGYMHCKSYVVPDAQRAKHYRRWLRRMVRP